MPANAGIHDFSKTVGKRFFFEKKKQKTSAPGGSDAAVPIVANYVNRFSNKTKLHAPFIKVSAGTSATSSKAYSPRGRNDLRPRFKKLLLFS
jgi:hypothetical protein